MRYLTYVTLWDVGSRERKRDPLVLGGELVCGVNLFIAFQAECGFVCATEELGLRSFAHVTLNLHADSEASWSELLWPSWKGFEREEEILKLGCVREKGTRGPSEKDRTKCAIFLKSVKINATWLGHRLCSFTLLNFSLNLSFSFFFFSFPRRIIHCSLWFQDKLRLWVGFCIFFVLKIMKRRLSLKVSE